MKFSIVVYIESDKTISFQTIAGTIKFLRVVSQVSKYSNGVMGYGSKMDSPYPTFHNSSVIFIIIGLSLSIFQNDTIKESCIGISSTRISAFAICIILRLDYFG